jgi:hypothetical protein
LHYLTMDFKMSSEELEDLKQYVTYNREDPLEEHAALEKYVREERIQKVYWKDSEGVRYTWGPGQSLHPTRS